MKFIVAGYGFVGSAIGNVLSKQHEIVPVDPRLNNNKIKDHMVDCDGVIIAVSTPANKDGTANVKNIWNVLQQIDESGFRFKPILIKSTITFDHLEEIQKDYSITYYPEFLREVTAMEDFVNQKYAILDSTEISHALPLVLTLFIISRFDFYDLLFCCLPALKDSDFNCLNSLIYVIPN